MLDEKANELVDAFRKGRFAVQGYVELLHDQAFQLRLEAEVKDRVAQRLVAEVNEGMPIPPDLGSG